MIDVENSYFIIYMFPGCIKEYTSLAFVSGNGCFTDNINTLSSLQVNFIYLITGKEKVLFFLVYFRQMNTMLI